ncbi:hypothetical protein HS088_TW20G00324 [Tripterygium wilfordii]|uniref:Uncharacterized protein n=1 Tax=Tripterygium wilfordii TaxID=458696 RepID=A0A7J7C7M7_TRIWF|nr:hypothetical protein HS088_TW20G00324 [Tripterygium wilfordii]
MENNDPFASLTELCQISSSQEDCLRSRFAGEPEPDPDPDDSNSSDDQDDSRDTGDIHVETTPIEILSPPESSEEKDNDGCSQQDQFHTPPEGSSLASSQGQQSVHHDHVAGDQSMAVDSDCTDISKAVDLGRDTDLGFSEEVELAQKRDSASGGDSSRAVVRVQENEVIQSESNVIRISNIQSSLNVGLTDSPMETFLLVTPTGKSVGKVAKSTEKLKSPSQNPKISEKDEDLGTPRACLGIVSEKSEKRSIISTMKLTSPLKDSENLGGNVNFDTPNARLGTNREEVKVGFAESLEKLKPDLATPQHDNTEALQNHQFSEAVLIGTSNDGESVHGKGSAKRKLKFPAEAIRSEVEGASGNSGFGEGIVNSRRSEVDSEDKRTCSHGKRKNIDDFDGCRSTSPSIAESPEIQRIAEGKRELPVSITGGSVQNAQRKNESGISPLKDNPWEYPILYTLRELEKYSNRDTTLEGLFLSKKG